MRDSDKASGVNKLPMSSTIKKLRKDVLIKLLKKYGLQTNVTVKEARKLLSKYVSSKKKIKANKPILGKEDQVNEPIFEMDETDSICFVCDQKISSDNWKYKLLETASKKRKVPLADLIKQLVGSEFAVMVGERDVICSGCMNLLNLMDAMAAKLKTVQSILSKHLFSKYNLESDSTKFQIEYYDSTTEQIEPLHKCSSCNFETKYEKEYNIHIRCHNIDKTAVESKSVTPKVQISKTVKNKRKTKFTSRKRKPSSKLHVKSKITKPTKPKKPKDIPKQKKTKIVFQCSVCNKMFPNETSIRFHAKKDHGNENIVVSDESEYEDIQTLESSDEENSNETKKKHVKPTVKPSLDFLDDWKEDEEDVDKNAKDSDTLEYPSVKSSSSKVEDISYTDHFNEEEEESEEEEDQLAKPTCLFCNAKFLSFESVQDHVKMTHRDKSSNLNTMLKTKPPVESFEIDSTTDIVENKHPRKMGNLNSGSKIVSYKCNLCGIKKVSLTFINKHIKAHKRKLALQCKLCGTSFKTIVAVKVHRYRCHKVVAVKQKCKQCKMIFFDISQLKTHIKKVHNKPTIHMKNKKSKVVDRQSISGYRLRKPLESTKLPRNFKKLSSKKVVTKSSDNSKISSSEVSSTSLENGTSLHFSTRKKYVCSLCNFVSNSDLEMKGHMKKHNIEDNVSKGKILTVSNKKGKDISKLKCLECQIYVADPRQLVNHMNRHKANACHDLGLCFYCNKLFLEKEQLIIHVNSAHNFKINSNCTVCGKHYAHGKDLKLHFLKSHFSTKTENLLKQISEHLLNKPGAKNSGSTEDNDVYSKVFKELQDLTGEGNEDVSLDLPMSSLRYSCPLCDFNDCNRSTLETHVSSHPQNYCNICKNLFNTEEVIKHIENHTIEFQNKECPECDGKFHDSLHLQYHSLRIHSGGKKIYKCTMCEKSFFSEKTLLAHKQTMHGKTSKKVFSCNKCKMNFYTEKEFDTHVEFAHRVVLNCKYCDKTLSNMKRLVQHEKNHLKQVRTIYKCNICGKVLKTLTALKSHKTMHNRNIPLQCEICSQSFKSFHTLREHSAKHSDSQEKRFFCSVCGKGFYFYDSHHIHRRIHLDPLLFKCKACGERFQSKLKRLQHKNVCSKSSKCSKCLKFFNTNSSLKKHVCLVKRSNVFSK